MKNQKSYDAYDLESKATKSRENPRSIREFSTAYGEGDHQNTNNNYQTRSNFSKTQQLFNMKNKTSNTKMFNSTNFSRNSNNPRLLGMSEFQSSSSFRNSTVVWSFSKSGRFTNGVYKKPLTDSLYELPDKKSHRSTTQGLGKRYDIRPLQGRDSPAADTYRVMSFVENNLQKKKGYFISEKTPELPNPTAEFPGPGTYKVCTSPGKSKKNMISLKSRIMFFYDDDLAKQKHCISPQKYLPSTKAVENMRYTTIGFGFGPRSPTEQAHNLLVPGPGTYNLPSVFDMNRKNKVPLN